MGQSKKSNQKGKNLFSFFKINYINKCDRTSHWVGHINDLLERKHMIEYMEAEMTEAPKQNSYIDNLAVYEEANVHKVITLEAKDSNDM